MTTKLFDPAIVGTAKQALDFIGNILESSTDYSIVGKDLDGRIRLWNEGARRLGGYAPEGSWDSPIALNANRAKAARLSSSCGTRLER